MPKFLASKKLLNGQLAQTQYIKNIYFDILRDRGQIELQALVDIFFKRTFLTNFSLKFTNLIKLGEIAANLWYFRTVKLAGKVSCKNFVMVFLTLTVSF